MGWLLGIFGMGAQLIQVGWGDVWGFDIGGAGDLRGAAGRARGKEPPIHDGGYRRGGVFGVLHAEPVVSRPSAASGAGGGAWAIELRDAVRDDQNPER